MASHLSPRVLFAQALVATAVVACAIAAYDVRVRVPNTPRLAVVDVNALYAAAHKTATKGALDMVDKSKGDRVGVDVAEAALGQIERTAADFGPRLGTALEGLARECQCTVVAMAAVYGADSGIPNYTGLMAERLGLQVSP